MTVSQLYNSVAQLGFEDSLENEERFIFAANRALLQVNALRPATSSYIINHKPMKNCISCATFDSIEKTDELFFYAEDVKAFYFEADGAGILQFEKYNDTTAEWDTILTVHFNNNGAFVPVRGHIKNGGEFVDGRIRMHFIGEYLYSVRNVAMYKHIYSADETKVPAYGAFTKYDISDLTTDFLTLASPPITEVNGIKYLNQGYDVENGKIILLPYESKGLYKVIYNRLPKNIEYNGEALTDDESVIDLAEDLSALLPILVASYVWIEDEPEKAQYYFNLYKDRAVDIERRIYDAKPAHIISTNGW